MKQLNIFLFLMVATILLVGCQANEEDLTNDNYSPTEFSILSTTLKTPEVPHSYGFGNLSSSIETDNKATLGRVLFYDKNLSADGTVSCASCHQQSLAFADDKAFSDGANENHTTRNSIALGSFRSFGRHYNETISEAEVPGLFWDERAGSIKEQLRQTINNPNEMGMELQQIVSLVESTDFYQVLHQKAFNSSDVTEDHILEALEIFINSINSVNSKFETSALSQLNFITGDNVTGALDNELGLRLFINNCNSCHTLSSNFLPEGTDSEPITIANNGLQQTQNDLGVFEHSQNAEDIGKFKVPGLLNIELTAPYMHDGRFASLEEVVDFYSTGINYSETLHPNLRDGDNAKRLNLNQQEKDALVSFLKLLTDQDITSDEKWSDPFLK